MMSKVSKKKKKHRRILFLWMGSLVIISVTTFTIGKYWVEIYDKYQEKKHLSVKYTKLKEKEAILKSDAKSYRIQITLLVMLEKNIYIQKMEKLY